MIRPILRTVVTTALGAVLVPAAVACSSGAAAAQQPAGGNDAFMQCMTEHGVPAPPAGGPGDAPPEGPPPGDAPPAEGPPPAPPGVDQQTWDAAGQACASLAPAPPGHR